jgi:drug/metabolite transporter (DMT)-like permease
MGGLAMFIVMYIQFRAECRQTEKDVTFLPKIKRKHWPRLLLVSIIGATLAPWLGIEGLGLTHGARASLWLALGPAISTGFGYLFSTEKMGGFGYAGVVLAAVGTAILAWDGLQPEQGYWLGDLILIVALALTVIELHLIKPLAREYGSISIVALRTAIGGALYLLIAAPDLIEVHWFSLGLWAWIAILAGGAVGVGVGQWVKVRALKILGPTQVVLYGNMVPIAALVIAWLSIGENPNAMEIISAVFIIAGAIFIQVIDSKAKAESPIEKKKEEDLTFFTKPKQES